MKNFSLIFIVFVALSSCLFAQEFSVKTGIGFPNVYNTDEVQYYRNKLKHESDPSFIFSLRLNWHLGGNFYLAWEPGIIEKQGKITGIAVGFDSLYNDLYGYDEYKLWNIENSVLLNYDLLTIKDFAINIYVGPGISLGVSDKQTFGPEIAGKPYTDYPNVDYENPYITNNSGLYLNAGINIKFMHFQFDVRYIKEYSDLWVSSIGRFRSYIFCLLVGYQI
jgi:hypothetical protein